MRAIKSHISSQIITSNRNCYCDGAEFCRHLCRKSEDICCNLSLHSNTSFVLFCFLVYVSNTCCVANIYIYLLCRPKKRSTRLSVPVKKHESILSSPLFIYGLLTDINVRQQLLLLKFLFVISAHITNLQS